MINAKKKARLPRRKTLKNPIQKPFDSDVLRIVAFSDYRVQDHDLLAQFITTLNPAPNVILYGGDDIGRFHSGSHNYFEELAALSSHGLCAVIGNDDQLSPSPNRLGKGSPRDYITGNNVFEVHTTPLILGKYAVVGSEAASFDKEVKPLGLCYPETVIAKHLSTAAGAVKGKRLIVISHAPPRGTLDTGIRFSGGGHIGSSALRDFLRNRRDVVVAICGHVHSCGAQSEKLNRCYVVNAASHDSPGDPGRVAIIDIRKNVVQNIEWHLVAEVADELCSVPGIKRPRAKMLRDAGIQTVAQLTVSTDEEIRAILNCGSDAGFIRRRALALHKHELVVERAINLPASSNRAYLDIETDLNSKWIWLIGVHVEQEDRTYPFYADSSEDEARKLAEFVTFTQRHPDLRFLSFSGSGTEQRMLRKRLAAYNLATDCISRIRDVYPEIYSCCAFPVRSMDLKTISDFCGFEARTDLDGPRAAQLYGSGRVDKRTKAKLLKYNEDDVLALKHVVLYVQKNSLERALAAQASLF